MSPCPKDSSKQQPHSAKPISLLRRKGQQQQLCQSLGSVLVLAMQYFFCFPLKNCETASSLSCPCRLTDRKCVFLHILAFASWVLHHLILDFFPPTAVTTFYFRLSQMFQHFLISMVSFPIPRLCQIMLWAWCWIGKFIQDRLDPSLLPQSA